MAALKTCKRRHFEGPVLEPVRTFQVWDPGHCSGLENAELSSLCRVSAVLPFRILSGSVAPLNIRIYHNLFILPVKAVLREAGGSGTVALRTAALAALDMKRKFTLESACLSA